jgi:hypothetical protein
MRYCHDFAVLYIRFSLPSNIIDHDRACKAYVLRYNLKKKNQDIYIYANYWRL